LSGDEARLGLANKANDTRDILKNPIAPDRNLAESYFAGGLRAFPADAARRDAIDRDVLFRILIGKRMREAFDSRFRRRNVCTAEMIGNVVADAADVDNAAPAVFQHEGNRRARTQESAVENDADEVPPLRKCHLGERRARPVGSIVDQNIDPPETRLDLAEHARDCVLSGDVRNADQRLAAHRFDLGLHLVCFIRRTARIDDNCRTVFGERVRGGATVAAHRTGDECNFSV
jgi:hypothetical protein